MIRSRCGSMEALRKRSSAVGGDGEIGYGFWCWVACFLWRWRLEKGSSDMCASQLKSQHVRRCVGVWGGGLIFFGLCC